MHNSFLLTIFIMVVVLVGAVLLLLAGQHRQKALRALREEDYRKALEEAGQHGVKVRAALRLIFGLLVVYVLLKLISPDLLSGNVSFEFLPWERSAVECVPAPTPALGTGYVTLESSFGCK